MQLISTSPSLLFASLLLLCSSAVHAGDCQKTTDIERERCVGDADSDFASVGDKQFGLGSHKTHL